MYRGLLQNDLFYCDHLGVSADDEKDIISFTVQKGLGLENYIRYNAFPDEDAGLMRTYIVRDNRTSELVAYFSIKAGLISLNERELEETDKETGETKTVTVFDTLPGAEIANFAVNDAYKERHRSMKGIGLIIFDSFIIPLINQSSKTLGLKVLYIFALPFESLIDRYKEYGFTRLDDEYEDDLHKRVKPFYDRSCIFMYRLL